MLCNSFRPRRMVIAGLVSAGFLLGAPHHAWAQG